MIYNEIEGDLITLGLEGKYDVVTHGCNCFCVMGSGIAPQMAKAFGADKFPLEADKFRGDINKLGMIDYGHIILPNTKQVSVVNSYTQYGTFGTHGQIPLDYAALELCFKKINHTFKGKLIGMPQIGCGLAGGSWLLVQDLIEQVMIDVNVEVVIYKP